MELKLDIPLVQDMQATIELIKNPRREKRFGIARRRQE